MSSAGLHGFLTFLKLNQSHLTNKLSGIMDQKTKAMESANDKALEFSDAKTAARAQYGLDSVEYDNAVSELTSQNEMDMYNMNEWEAELSSQENLATTQLTMVKEAITGVKKEEQTVIKEEFTYGSSAT